MYRVPGYYYLHENKDLIYKKNFDETYEDLMDSDLVITFWPMEPQDRAGAWTILIEGLAAGANVQRIKELADKWGCNDIDAQEYAGRYGVHLSMDGNQCCATRKDFVDLAESPAGFGPTYLEAMASLCRSLGYKPSKGGWNKSFIELVHVDSNPISEEY